MMFCVRLRRVKDDSNAINDDVPMKALEEERVSKQNSRTACVMSSFGNVRLSVRISVVAMSDK